MIKVLIVDDDKLVRKGLILTMPWKDYQMEVVGEAKNGEKALEFLASNEVDLMLTDLSMPVMSGLELMKIVNKEYAHVFIVVLTMHQDFEYIQGALRLGAIDYIAKVQMEVESFGEVLERVSKRMIEDQGKRKQQDSKRIDIDEGYVLISLENIADKGPRIEGAYFESHSTMIGSGLWLWLPSSDEEGKNIGVTLREGNERSIQDWTIITLKGMKGKQIEELKELLIKYKEKQFFYDFHPEHKVIQQSIDDIKVAVTSYSAQTELLSLKEQWLSLKWIQQMTVFENLLQELKTLYLPPAKLVNVLYSFANEWMQIYSPVIPKIDIPDEFNSWYEIEEWLYAIRTMINESSMGNKLYSSGVQESIAKAVRCIHEELALPVHASDIAIRVNMSRSYFSQCFKDVVGMTFNEYVRHVRMEKAKQYLVLTNKTISWIAENTGYADEKYFSRIFRKKTGVLPSEYRKQNQNG